jgi:hypothetical protein
MQSDKYSHRYADLILNGDYDLKKEIEEIIEELSFEDCKTRFVTENQQRVGRGKKPAKGYQSTLNVLFREGFNRRGWESEKAVFGSADNDLAIDFWKNKVGVDVAFVHGSFIGGDLLRLQAAAEVKKVVKVGVYICPTKLFAKCVSPDGNSMVSYERARWYLKNFYSVLTVPIFLIGLKA